MAQADDYCTTTLARSGGLPIPAATRSLPPVIADAEEAIARIVEAGSIMVIVPARTATGWLAGGEARLLVIEADDALIDYLCAFGSHDEDDEDNGDREQDDCDDEESEADEDDDPAEADCRP